MIQEKKKEPAASTFFDKNSVFSNFYKLTTPIVYEGKLYPTSEHLYQAFKFLGVSTDADEFAEHIRVQSTPFKAKTLGNMWVSNQYIWQQDLQKIVVKYKLLNVKCREDWDSVKISCMWKVLELKFQQESLRNALLRTGNEILIEDSQTDAFWGCGADRKGANHLGKLLMELRSSLRKSDAKATFFLPKKKIQK